jgi:hypothetical protein
MGTRALGKPCVLRAGALPLRDLKSQSFLRLCTPAKETSTTGSIRPPGGRHTAWRDQTTECGVFVAWEPHTSGFALLGVAFTLPSARLAVAQPSLTHSPRAQVRAMRVVMDHKRQLSGVRDRFVAQAAEFLTVRWGRESCHGCPFVLKTRHSTIHKRFVSRNLPPPPPPVCNRFSTHPFGVRTNQPWVRIRRVLGVVLGAGETTTGGGWWAGVHPRADGACAARLGVAAPHGCLSPSHLPTMTVYAAGVGRGTSAR